MNHILLLSAGAMFMLMLVGSAIMMLHQSRHQERYAARIRLVHGQGDHRGLPAQVGHVPEVPSFRHVSPIGASPPDDAHDVCTPGAAHAPPHAQTSRNPAPSLSRHLPGGRSRCRC